MTNSIKKSIMNNYINHTCIIFNILYKILNEDESYFLETKKRDESEISICMCHVQQRVFGS